MEGRRGLCRGLMLRRVRVEIGGEGGEKRVGVHELGAGFYLTGYWSLI